MCALKPQKTEAAAVEEKFFVEEPVYRRHPNQLYQRRTAPEFVQPTPGCQAERPLVHMVGVVLVHGRNPLVQGVFLFMPLVTKPLPPGVMPLLLPLPNPFWVF